MKGNYKVYRHDKFDKELLKSFDTEDEAWNYVDHLNAVNLSGGYEFYERVFYTVEDNNK